MDPIRLSDISQAIRDHYDSGGSGCKEAQNVIEQTTKFDKKEAKSSLELATFHDSSGRMIYESYVPKGFSDSQAADFASRLIPAHNPLKEKVKNSSVKRK